MGRSDPAHRLRIAASEGNLYLVKKLYEERGVNIQSQDMAGKTALMYATENGQKEVVEYLLDQGHEEKEISKDFEGNTVLIVATEKREEEIFTIYVKRYPETVLMANKAGVFPLIIAAKEGYNNLVNIILDYGGDINQTDSQGCTALHHAAAWGHLKTATLLLERGCRHNHQNFAGWTAVDYAYNIPIKLHLEEYAKKPFESSKRFAVAIPTLSGLDLASHTLMSDTRTAPASPHTQATPVAYRNRSHSASDKLA
ncbi:ankyrin [Basidiobolus meristosporus CBS 931.73]|uniref:Ankyrin n=1 Tax=Basidiobolus meristosporus CBS 931.73 TaxID=1314790 RepID=A0A1Y1YF49_9FUNG|nr:ankyrin [Basidiobolus meristosporus CBS 931.73]|eukprot:ORX96607.1 ankyrin [Basidiobolus meristosporus CBS 931.73]